MPLEQLNQSKNYSNEATSLNKDLNTEQRVVINNIHEALLVLAPAGTGKTMLLAERVIEALKNGFNPEEILCVTFTNRASKELRKRVEEAIPKKSNKIWIKTFHGLCASILYKEARNIGLPSDFVIYDEEDSKELIDDLRKNNDQFIPIDSKSINILNIFSEVKDKTKKQDLQLLGLKDDCLPYQFRAIFAAYSSALSERHALDFSDLVYFTRFALYYDKSTQHRWKNNFKFLQIDEAQDTHLAEYDVINCLSNTNNIALFGDMDQSVYGWRGAEPEVVIQAFEQDYSPRRICLTKNFRATKNLLLAADSFANQFKNRWTKLVPDDNCNEGNKIQTYYGHDIIDESLWISKQINKILQNNNYNHGDIAVLARTNYLCRKVSEILNNKNIPCLTVEEYQFFRRQEVKDALSFLKLIINPYDISSANRIALRYTQGVGKETLKKIIFEGNSIGVKITDLFKSSTFQYFDPFGRFIYHFLNKEIVVFDTETTGLSTTQDNIIEIAAIKLKKGRPIAKFDKLLKSNIFVGHSYYVHNISDQVLEEFGEEPSKVFEEFKAFCSGCLLSGYNVQYDYSILCANASRCGIDFGNFQYDDIYEMTKRCVKHESYKLKDICYFFNVNTPTHRAIEDVKSTIYVMYKLFNIIYQSNDKRKTFVKKYSNFFKPEAKKLDFFRYKAHHVRTYLLVYKIIQKFGILDYYSDELSRILNLQQLINTFKERDIHDYSFVNLQCLVQFASLAKNIDYVNEDLDKVFSITVHQAKGLEFKNVFIASALEGIIPDFRSEGLPEEEEEKRVFYVAQTRAKDNLCISGHKHYETPNGHIIQKRLSPYLKCIDKSFFTQESINILNMS